MSCFVGTPNTSFLRVIGVMRLCNAFADYCHLTITPAASFCHGICFLTNRITSSAALEAMSACSNRIATQEATQPWTHETSLREAYELGIACGADWVVIPDHDEILPYEHLPGQIAEAERAGKMVISFPFINCWQSPSKIVDPALNVTGDHGKVFRRGISNFREGTFCIPEGYWDSIQESPYPLRHCHMMTGSLRTRRLAERGEIEPWAMDQPPTIPYVSDWAINQYPRNLAHVETNSSATVTAKND